MGGHSILNPRFETRGCSRRVRMSFVEENISTSDCPLDIRMPPTCSQNLWGGTERSCSTHAVAWTRVQYTEPSFRYAWALWKHSVRQARLSFDIRMPPTCLEFVRRFNSEAQHCETKKEK